MKHTIHVEFRDDWEPIQYSGDPPATDAEAWCAEQARAYIEREGIYRFLTEWNILYDMDVWVGSTQVARQGRAVAAADSVNTAGEDDG